jgi:RNA polymerase sigma-70 factor (ECF subfamily)
MCLRKRHDEISLDRFIQGQGYSLVHDFPERRFNPEESYLHVEANRKLHQELATLPERLRFALTLRDFHGYSTQEVAKELGLTIAAVKSRILRGRRRLRNRLR